MPQLTLLAIATTGGPSVIRALSFDAEARRSQIALYDQSHIPVGVDAHFHGFDEKLRRRLRELGFDIPSAPMLLEVDAGVDAGASWQLGLAAAHILSATGALVFDDAQAEQRLLVTGQVGTSKWEAQPVGGVPDKRRTAAGFLTPDDAEAAQFLIPAGNAEDLAAEGEGADDPLIGLVTDLDDLIAQLAPASNEARLAADPKTEHQGDRSHTLRWAAAGFGFVAVLGLATQLISRGPAPASEAPNIGASPSVMVAPSPSLASPAANDAFSAAAWRAAQTLAAPIAADAAVATATTSPKPRLWRPDASGPPEPPDATSATGQTLSEGGGALAPVSAMAVSWTAPALSEPEPDAGVQPPPPVAPFREPSLRISVESVDFGSDCGPESGSGFANEPSAAAGLQVISDTATEIRLPFGSSLCSLRIAMQDAEAVDGATIEVTANPREAISAIWSDQTGRSVDLTISQRRRTPFELTIMYRWRDYAGAETWRREQRDFTVFR